MPAGVHRSLPGPRHRRRLPPGQAARRRLPLAHRPAGGDDRLPSRGDHERSADRGEYDRDRAHQRRTAHPRAHARPRPPRLGAARPARVLARPPDPAPAAARRTATVTGSGYECRSRCDRLVPAGRPPPGRAAPVPGRPRAPDLQPRPAPGGRPHRHPGRRDLRRRVHPD